MDACDGGCGGIWFDHFEFKKFDEPTEPNAEEVLHLKINPKISVDTNKPRMCPKCGTYKLMHHFSSMKMKVMVDECPKCAGIWLDAGELKQIREEFPSEAERSKATDQAISHLFGKQMMQEEAKFKQSLGQGSVFKFVVNNFKFSKK